MRTSLALGVGASALVVASAPPATADDHVVADNLTSPLGFAVADDGTLYVAEAFAGLLTQIDPDGTRTELASAPPGSGTAGVALTNNGSVYYTLTLPPEVGGAPETALARVNPDGSTQVLASLSDFEAANNPDADNEYGVLQDGSASTDSSSTRSTSADRSAPTASWSPTRTPSPTRDTAAPSSRTRQATPSCAW